MSFVTLNTVSKAYKKGKNVISDISLQIQAGEFLVIVGPSGCGKSTLLRMIAGLEPVSSGTISIDGKDVTNEEPGVRDIAMVFQNYALYPHMNVYDNMAYGLRNRSVPETEIKKRVETAAHSLQLEEYLQRKPNQLSGGQRQRVAMGRAIVRNPKVFLFDEPLSNLDAKLRTKMRVEIKQIQRQLDTTSIYVTHDQIEAMTLADRLIVLNQGIIEQQGPPHELYAKPKTVFVAGFLGSPSMNFLPSECLERQPPHSADQLLYGIRPEHFQILNNGANADIELRSKVTAIEHLGSDVLIYAQSLMNDVPIVLRTGTGIDVKIGDKIRIGAGINETHLFDNTTGQRRD